LIIEKATELGRAAIVPLRSDRVVGERRDHKDRAWQRLAKTASQQCGQRHPSVVGSDPSWDELLATFPSYDRVYIPWELADVQPLRATFEADAPHIASALFVIGPEGGFSSHEVERAIAPVRWHLGSAPHPTHRKPSRWSYSRVRLRPRRV